MRIIEKYIIYTGLRKETSPQIDIAGYHSTGNIDIAQRHLDYLKEHHEYQKTRQDTIENKNSQLVGQASIIISIFSLFIPLLIDKLTSQSLLIIIPLISGFVFILFHYVLTIYHSTKTLEINRYQYVTRNTTTVTNLNRATTELDFLNEEINDLIIATERNDIQNNRKGANLIYATRNFRIASISFAFFTLLIIGISFSLKSKPQEIEIAKINNKIMTDINKVIIDSIQTKDYHADFIELNKGIEKINIHLDSINKKLLCTTHGHKTLWAKR